MRGIAIAAALAFASAAGAQPSLRMRRSGIPVAPAVIGLILGPLAETQFRRALSISEGDASVFFTHPISAGFLTLTALLIVLPWVVRRLRRPGA